MDLTPTNPVGRQQIEAYGEGGFRISGVRWRGSVLVFRDETIAWPVNAFADIETVHLTPIIEAVGADSSIEILLLGCGQQMAIVDPRLRARLRDSGIGIEPMDTGAACRTFNVLVNEDRKVAAALIAI